MFFSEFEEVVGRKTETHTRARRNILILLLFTGFHIHSHFHIRPRFRVSTCFFLLFTSLRRTSETRVSILSVGYYRQ